MSRSDEEPPIFVVASDPAVLRSMQFLLQAQGFPVRLCDDGAALLEAADWPSRGCLVIDQNLGERTGLDFLTLMRARGVTLPAVLVVPEATADLQRRAAAAGAFRVLSQPLERSLLSETLRAALARPIA